MIDKATGQISDIFPYQGQALCETWEGSEEAVKREVRISLIAPLPEGYEIREMQAGDEPAGDEDVSGYYWVTQDTGIPPEAIYPTMLETIAAAWVDIEPLPDV